MWLSTESINGIHQPNLSTTNYRRNGNLHLSVPRVQWGGSRGASAGSFIPRQPRRSPPRFNSSLLIHTGFYQPCLLDNGNWVDNKTHTLRRHSSWRLVLRPRHSSNERMAHSMIVRVLYLIDWSIKEEERREKRERERRRKKIQNKRTKWMEMPLFDVQKRRRSKPVSVFMEHVKP